MKMIAILMIASTIVIIGQVTAAETNDTQIARLQLQVEQLKKENELLRKENQKLRSKFVTKGTSGKNVPSDASAAVNEHAGQNPAVLNEEYWLSSSNKRHNSKCRYFKKSKGKSCGKDDGTPCKICGG